MARSGVTGGVGAAACAGVVAAVLGALLQPGAPARAEEPDAEAPSTAAPKREADARAAFIDDVCRRIEAAARQWKLPPGFLARLIWKESRFDAGAVSPKGARGIAQFMPGTAQMRGLEDPFDPRSAIPASAHYLSDLRDAFGNLGLAAAAYNAGPNRVRSWRAGSIGLPGETRDFVLSITGFPARDWNGPRPPETDHALDRKLSFLEACRRLPVRRRFRPPHLIFTGAPWQPWGVHLAADWSPTRALSRYAALQRAFPAVLADREPMVLRVVRYSFGKAPRFEVRVGQPDRAGANRFCKRLRQAGGLCLVYRTPRR